MTSSLTRQQTLVDKTITIRLYLSAKDAADDSLIKKFGDIIIEPSGYFSDPDDLSYPEFYVYAGNAVSFFTNGEVRAVFQNENLTIPDLQRRANLWGNNIQLDIQNAMIALRALTDTTTSTTTVQI